MQWDQTARSDAAVIGPPQRASINLGTGTLALPLSSAELEVPYYLNAHYWWAYIHPTAVQLFERQWLINLILWGNYARLRMLSWQKWEILCRDARCRSHVPMVT